MKVVQFEDLLEQIQKSGRNYDIERITAAYKTAEKAHEGQRRASGEPYVTHPVAVASILVDLGMDTDTLMAALLHDVVEDTDYTLEDIQKLYGKDIALMVDGVTKLGRIPFSSREEQQAENVRKMLLAMAQDIRVILIKLCDRLHNMRTIAAMPPQKQRDKALETMEIYAPLAHRLGIRPVKEELEDISISYLDPIAYQEIEKELNMKKDDRTKFLEKIIERIRERMADEGVEMHLEGRVKSIYGIYRKVYMQGRSFEEIFDIYAVRIIVNTVTECYNMLGIIHDMFTPLPNRFKDYISTPKANMYQSLHTTVLDKEAIPFEVQIRTWDMHHVAEYGIAAHWKYKAGISGKDRLEDRLAWVRQVLEVQMESESPEDVVSTIKSDLSADEVFVFTPKGDVMNLPTGSTVIDFAYAIHSAVGSRMVGAKVNGRMVSLDYQVKTGEVIEVLTSNSKNQGPSRDWLKIVKTSEARNKIRQWFKKERREENIQEGKQELEREFRRNTIALPDAQMAEFIENIAKRQKFANVEEFYAAIGYGGVSLSKIIPRVKEDFIRQYRTPESNKTEAVVQKPKRERKASSGVIVEGLDSCLVKFAKCCNPLPGDDIIGFVTRGYGVSIHKRDCINVQNNIEDPEQKNRFVQATWQQNVRESFKSTLDIYATGRPGIIADLSIQLANMRIALHSLNAREAKDDHTQIQITMSIESVDQLNYVINNLKKINGIISIERNIGG